MKEMRYNKYAEIYNRGTLNVIIFACVIIALSILATGTASYRIVEDAVIKKLKSQDLVYILKSISSQVDSSIERAQEISLLIADSPVVIKWFQGGEKDKALGDMAIQQMLGMAKSTKYTDIFMANVKTGHFWTSTNMLTDTLTEDDPDDSWFFDSLSSNKKTMLNIDHNNELDKTLLWVNTLMGAAGSPAGVAGIGVDLEDIAKEFRQYKIGDKSNLWLVDNTGKINISEDIEQTGDNLINYLPRDIYNTVMQNSTASKQTPCVLNYRDKEGEIDLIFKKLESCDWVLVFQIERSETVAVLNTIMVNTLITAMAVIVLILVIFYFVSSKIANPYKRAIQLNVELEKEIQQRTAEVNEKNHKIMESIDYAKKMQESILPSGDLLKSFFTDHFIIWKPRDVVGGDFYWVKEAKDGKIIVVGDCTGHGVPGALMTMAVNSILSNIVMVNGGAKPADVIRELDRLLKEALNKKDNCSTDDGLDAAVCCYDNDGKLYFAGAGMSMYMARGGKVNRLTGFKRGIGYKKSVFSSDFKDTVIKLNENDRFYITTDGYLDQNGGPKNYSLGTRRFVELIGRYCGHCMAEQKAQLERALYEYMGDEPQRDDIMVMGFATRK